MKQYDKFVEEANRSKPLPFFIVGEMGYVIMRCMGKTIGVAAFTFGVGVLLCALLPAPVLVCIQAAIIVTAGFLLFAK